MSERAFVVALLGAESTGKTTLAQEIGAALAARGLSVAVVAEVLREFCDAHARTPRRDEQAAIAAAQSERIDAAAARHEIVVADTSAMMIAIYSDLVFADASLYASALAAQRRCDLTLVTALDLPWQSDGLQRDGPHVRAPVDALLRTAARESASRRSPASATSASRRRCARSTPRWRRAARRGADAADSTR
jgi:nicotinamide riboside kinase